MDEARVIPHLHAIGRVLFDKGCAGLGSWEVHIVKSSKRDLYVKVAGLVFLLRLDNQYLEVPQVLNPRPMLDICETKHIGHLHIDISSNCYMHQLHNAGGYECDECQRVYRACRYFMACRDCDYDCCCYCVPKHIHVLRKYDCTCQYVGARLTLNED
uniref:Uncharacterized protein n=1 Tax=viral metagenome TaxID=1070528 RepID=A0A6C0BPX3_9ZZZZ